MSNFQDRFKGKTSTVSKEGVIPSLDKPPLKSYIEKNPTSNGLVRATQIQEQRGGSNNQNNPYTLNSQQDIGAAKNQSSSNTNFSTKSYKSGSSQISKVSISSKMQNQKQQQQQQIPSNSPYFIQNPFSLDQQPLGINYNSNSVLDKNGLISVPSNSVLNSNVTSHSLLPQNKYAGYTVQTNNPQQPVNHKQQNQNGNGNPYTVVNPYTIEAIEHGKMQQSATQASSSSDIASNNANKAIKASKEQLQQQQIQEKEANEYIQSCVPSFSPYQPSKVPEGQAGQNIQPKNIVYDFVGIQQRGGLGANTGTSEWNAKKEKSDKMMEYSAQVKYFNQQQQPASNQRKQKAQEDDAKSKSSRSKAMEFSKNIPKPRVRTEKNVTEDTGRQSDKQNSYPYSEDTTPNNRKNGNYVPAKNNFQQQYESEIDILEKQHLEYLNKVEQLNINS